MSKEFSLQNLFFGSIAKKLGVAFVILFILLITMIFITYNINKQIESDALAIRNVEAPLELMVEQVMGYDAILTGNAHEALLHAENNELLKIAEHKEKYDSAGIALDNLLKTDAITLLNQSKRSQKDKAKVNYYLKQFDAINLKLVDLELGAFVAMQTGDINKARSLIVTEQYERYKSELAQLYNEWATVEKSITEQYRQKVLTNSINVRSYNVILGLLFILISLIIPFFVYKYIIEPISKIHVLSTNLRNGIYGQTVDINTNDEVQDLAESLNKTSTSLMQLDLERQELDKAKTEFLSITSHELRSPMTPMKAQLQMLLKEYFGKLNAKQKESIEVVVRNTDRLDRIIVDFLDVARIESARLKFNFIKTNLVDETKRVIKEIDAFLSEKRIVLTLNIEDLPIIETDPDRVMQVLRNLLTNAKKFSNDNGKIDVTVTVEHDMIKFEVKDNGIGIKPEDQIRLFEPFYQAEKTMYRKYGGTGLGLTISKGIIESQKGKIWLESEYGKGTTFYFTVPFVPVKEMKPIRLLFSDKDNKERNLQKLFVEFLGPLGNAEFETLRKAKLTDETVLKYIENLEKQNIIQKEFVDVFRKKVKQLFKR